jgi:hypothetical protein
MRYQVVEPTRVELAGHHPLHDLADGAPVHPQQTAHRGLVGLGGKPGDEVVDIAGQPHPVTGEGHLFDHHPVVGTRQAAQRRAHPPLPHTQVQRPPRRRLRLHVMPRLRGPAAVGADEPPAAQPHVHHHLHSAELHRDNPHPRQREQMIEYGCVAHSDDPLDSEPPNSSEVSIIPRATHHPPPTGSRRPLTCDDRSEPGKTDLLVVQEAPVSSARHLEPCGRVRGWIGAGLGRR